MATYYARANGNVNATNVWSTTQAGATSDLFPSFTNADTLMANGFTITLNVNTTVLEVRNDTTGSATNGGGFTLNSGVTLTANCISGTIALLTYNGGVGATASIVGNVTSNGGNCVTFATGGVGTLNITGAINGTSGVGLYINGGTTVNINGNITASTGRGAYIVNVLPTVNITGNIIGGSTAAGFDSFSGGVATGGSITVTGNITGGSGAAGMALVANVNTAVVVVGSVIGGSGNAGITVASSSGSTITLTRAKGNGFGNGSSGLTSNVGIANNSQPSIVRVYEIEYGDLGQSPTSGPVFLFPASSNVALFYRSGTTKKTLVDASSSSGLLPNQSDVRAGTTYNAGTNTGTMSVPTAASVALGVNVDNTTGTAILTSGNIGDIWNYPVSGISVSNSIGERLKNCSTVASMGQQLAAALNNVQ